MVTSDAVTFGSEHLIALIAMEAEHLGTAFMAEREAHGLQTYTPPRQGWRRHLKGRAGERIDAALTASSERVPLLA